MSLRLCHGERDVLVVVASSQTKLGFKLVRFLGRRRALKPLMVTSYGPEFEELSAATRAIDSSKSK
jgi:hypothetical protein